MFAKIVDVMPVVVLQFAKVKVFRGMSFANCIFFYIIQFLLFVVRYSFVAILILDLLFYVDILDKISLHNVMSTTRLLLNPDIDDVVSFRHRYSPLFCPLTTLFVFKLFEVLPFMVLRQVSMFLSLVLVLSHPLRRSFYAHIPLRPLLVCMRWLMMEPSLLLRLLLVWLMRRIGGMLPVNAIRVCLLTLAPTTAVGVTSMFSK
jgi:hypothetical protein